MLHWEAPSPLLAALIGWIGGRTGSGDSPDLASTSEKKFHFRMVIAPFKRSSCPQSAF